jgi:hypothetical protein
MDDVIACLCRIFDLTAVGILCPAAVYCMIEVSSSWAASGRRLGCDNRSRETTRTDGLSTS